MSEKLFMIVWGTIFIADNVFNAFMLSKNRSATAGKRFFPFATISVAVIFAVLPVVSLYPSPLSLIFVIGLGLITFLNIEFTKFCDNCEKFRHNKNFFEAMNFCSKCGKKFA